jgi:hypothetical protein
MGHDLIVCFSGRINDAHHELIFVIVALGRSAIAVAMRHGFSLMGHAGKKYLALHLLAFLSVGGRQIK